MTVRNLREFKIKRVQGLYIFNHYETDDGAFIQIHIREPRGVYQEADGTRHEFKLLDELRAKGLVK